MKRLTRIINFLKIWDGVWSVPVAMLAFFGAGYAITAFFGPESGAMYPVFVQRLFYASLCLVIMNFVVLFGMYMNWKNVFKYYLEENNDFKELDPKFKAKLCLIIYFGYALLFTMFLILV